MSKVVDLVKLADFYAANDWPRERHMTHNEEPSLTRQEFADECDINTLMKQYEKHAGTGAGNLLNPRSAEPFYADFTALPGSLLEYMAFMDAAETQFMTLPAAVRREFDNSAHMFVEFASDPANLEQMRTWGLAAPAPKEDPPTRVTIVGDPGQAEPPAQPAASPGTSTHGST